MSKFVSSVFLVLILCIATVSVSFLDNILISELGLEDASQSSSIIDCSNDTRSVGSPIHVDNQLGNNSNSGSTVCPVETVEQAISIAVDNDTIEIHEGVYHESIYIP